MDFKDIIITIVICVLVVLGLQYFKQVDSSDKTVGTTYLKEAMSAPSYYIDGTEVLNSSREITVTKSTNSGDSSIADDLTVGSTTGNGCIGKYKGGVLYYIDFATTTGNGTFIVTSTKPTGCD